MSRCGNDKLARIQCGLPSFVTKDVQDSCYHEQHSRYSLFLNTMHSSLRRLDLNLLLVFDSLYRSRKVMVTAEELSITPSACSHALSRLRATLSDELFVRYGSTMQPTVLAEQMADDVSNALRILSDRLNNSGPFKPASSTQTFVFAATDYTAFALLPRLIPLLEQRAPHLHVKVVYSNQRDALNDLEAGLVHFALGFYDENTNSNPGEGIETLDFFTDEYVITARKQHSRLGNTLSLEQYLSERHIVVLPWSEEGSLIDAILAQEHLHRDIAVHLPSVMAAPSIVASSDLLITIPLSVVRKFHTDLPLKTYPAPFEIPRFTLRAIFHGRYASIPGHKWIREQMCMALGMDNLQSP